MAMGLGISPAGDSLGYRLMAMGLGYRLMAIAWEYRRMAMSLGYRLMAIGLEYRLLAVAFFVNGTSASINGVKCRLYGVDCFKSKIMLVRTAVRPLKRAVGAVCVVWIASKVK
ncbi:MAG: hypothetical protein RR918_05475 [Anaerovoracaceae bacterium]